MTWFIPKMKYIFCTSHCPNKILSAISDRLLLSATSNKILLSVILDRRLLSAISDRLLLSAILDRFLLSAGIRLRVWTLKSGQFVIFSQCHGGVVWTTLMITC